MTNEPVHVDFDQFLADPQHVFDQVRRRGGPVLVEHDGETYRVEQEFPVGTWKTIDVDAARQALHRSVGALAGVDLDELLIDLRNGRGQDSGGRPA